MWAPKRIARASVIAGIGLGIVVGPTAPPVQADCLYLDFWVNVEDSDGNGQDEHEYVHLGCVTNTDYPWVATVPAHGNRENLPPGTPKGFYFLLHVPVP